MDWQVDHIFVCTATGAPEAAELRDAGLVEGAPNTHPGQGTANRRFFFGNGFLELLYVTDESEARSERTAPTRLWERWSGRDAGANPFGICLSSPSGARSDLPFPAWPYTPDYLPAGRAILFAEGQPLTEPELFALDWPHRPATDGQPLDHPLGLRNIIAVSLGLPNIDLASGALRAAADAGLVTLHSSTRPELLATFSAPAAVEKTIPSLGLRLVGRRIPDAGTVSRFAKRKLPDA